MKTWYVCETCGKRYETAEDALTCEVAHEAEATKKKKLKEEKAARTKEIQDLVEKFIDDYKETPTVRVTKEYPDSLFNWFLG